MTSDQQRENPTVSKHEMYPDIFLRHSLILQLGVFLVGTAIPVTSRPDVRLVEWSKKPTHWKIILIAYGALDWKALTFRKSVHRGIITIWEGQYEVFLFQELEKKMERKKSKFSLCKTVEFQTTLAGIILLEDFSSQEPDSLKFRPSQTQILEPPCTATQRNRPHSISSSK